MIWLIYLLSGSAAGFLLYGIFQLRFKKLEVEHRKIDVSTSMVFKLIKPLMQVLAHYNKRIISPRSEAAYKKKLVLSGNPLHLIPAEFLAIKQIGSFTGFLMGLCLFFTLKATPSLIVLFMVGGFFLPNLWLREMIARRKHLLFIALPFSMDMLTLVVEAGLSFTQAINEVVKRGPSGPLQEEFARMVRDLRLGVSPREALAGMADRTDMSEIRSFTAALIQADRLGSPISEALRIQSEIRRTERFQKAEKMAQEAPVKMLFPLLCFIFPAVFIILLGPIVLKFMAEGM